MNERRPRRVVFAPPTIPFVSAKDKTHGQVDRGVSERFRRGKRIQENIARILSECCRIRGAEVDLIQTNNDASWGLDCMSALASQLFGTKVHGCAYGDRDGEGRLVRRCWRVLSTDARVPGRLNKTCTNKVGGCHNHKHGSSADVELFIPKMLARGWARLVFHQKNWSSFLVEAHAAVRAGMEDETPAPKTTESMTKEELTALWRLHRDLGHPSNKVLARILRSQGARDAVVSGALNFDGHACGSGVMPKAVGKVAGAHIPQPLDVIGRDGWEWEHPKQNRQKYTMTLATDEGSGPTQVTNHGKTKGNRNWNQVK